MGETKNTNHILSLFLLNQFKMLAMYKTIFVVLAIGFTFDNATAQSGNGPATAEDKIVAAAGHMLPGISPKGSKAPKSSKEMKEMREMRGSKAPKANKKG